MKDLEILATLEQDAIQRSFKLIVFSDEGHVITCDDGSLVAALVPEGVKLADDEFFCQWDASVDSTVRATFAAIAEALGIHGKDYTDGYTKGQADAYKDAFNRVTGTNRSVSTPASRDTLAYDPYKDLFTSKPLAAPSS